MPDIDRRGKRAAEQRADGRADTVGQQDLAQAVIVAGRGDALHVVHALGEVVATQRHRSDEQGANITEGLGEIGRRIWQAQTELTQGCGNLRRLHQIVEIKKLGQPGEHCAQHHRG